MQVQLRIYTRVIFENSAKIARALDRRVQVERVEQFLIARAFVR